MLGKLVSIVVILVTLPPRTSPVPMLVHTGSGAEKGGICHGQEASHSGADHQQAQGGEGQWGTTPNLSELGEQAVGSDADRERL